MQTKLSVISNIFFQYFLIFAISFMWLNFYNNNLIFVALLSIIITLVLNHIINLVAKKRKNKIKLNLKEQEKMKDISFQLLMADKKDIQIFFTILLKINHTPKILKTKNTIICDNFAFIPFYKKKELSEDDLLEICKNNKYENIIISCVSYSLDAETLSQKIASSKIHLLNETQLFNILKKYDLYPDFNFPTNQKEKFKYSQLKNIAFTKKNSKHYLFSGFIILFTSIFIKYNIYYLVFATLLFVFAGISFFKPQTKKLDIVDKI